MQNFSLDYYQTLFNAFFLKYTVELVADFSIQISIIPSNLCRIRSRRTYVIDWKTGSWIQLIHKIKVARILFTHSHRNTHKYKCVLVCVDVYWLDSISTWQSGGGGRVKLLKKEKKKEFYFIRCCGSMQRCIHVFCSCLCVCFRIFLYKKAFFDEKPSTLPMSRLNFKPNINIYIPSGHAI